MMNMSKYRKDRNVGIALLKILMSFIVVLGHFWTGASTKWGEHLFPVCAGFFLDIISFKRR